MAESDDRELEKSAESPAAAPEGKPEARRRSPAFRQGLLSKLPQLAASTWEVSDALNVYEDMQAIAALDADAFLQPLEKGAEHRHG